MTLAILRAIAFVRLQPMVVMGSVIGAALFSFSASLLFPSVAGTPVWLMLLVMAIGFF